MTDPPTQPPQDRAPAAPGNDLVPASPRSGAERGEQVYDVPGVSSTDLPHLLDDDLPAFLADPARGEQDAAPAAVHQSPAPGTQPRVQQGGSASRILAESPLPQPTTFSGDVLAPRSVFFRDNAYRAVREALTLAAVLVMVAGVTAAFAWPWLPAPPIGGDALARYTPVRDGDARLMHRTSGDGTTMGWLAQNTRLIPGLRFATDARKAVGEAFMAALREPDEAELSEDEFQRRLGMLTFMETRSYEIDTSGKVTESWHYVARGPQGDRLIAFSHPQESHDTVFNPPVLQLPPEIPVGAAWESSGTFADIQYNATGRVLSIGRYDGAAGEFDDCLQVETTITFSGVAGGTPNVLRDWYCAGLGWVEGHTLEANGELKQRTVWLGANGAMLADAPLPPPQPMLEQLPAPAEADRWRLTRLGRARATGEASESTVLPTWIATEPPLVLAAGFGSDLVAFETYTPGAPPRWRFHTDGVVYGQPAFDPAAGRIYFGSSDKRLYALDTRGLFLWSFPTDDNVAARPLVVGDLVVAASEDGKVYGIEAATGRQRWVFEADDGIASWPALAGDVVVVGSDDSNVYGLDPETGEKRWSLAVDGAVEAPIVVDADGQSVYVASRDGSLTAFKPSECADECEASWSAEPGDSLRTAPLVADNLVVVIDEVGALIAVSKEDGKRQWSLGGVTYVGAPVLVDDAIVAASAAGLVERIGLDGKRLDRWEAQAAANPADGEPAFTFGPVVGGDALWIGDTNAVVRRLGAPPLNAIPGLRLAWIDQGGRPPFASSQLRNTVVEHDGRAVVLDFTKGVFLIDPEDGSGARFATLPGDGLLAQIDPVLAGDTLLTVSVSTLQALDLTSGHLRWQGVGSGYTVRPPVVSGQTVLWVTAGEGTGTLLALDLGTGALRWQASLGNVAQVGGVTASADTAFTSTPPAAWDLQTGQQRWRASFPGFTLAGPALSPDARTVYLSGVQVDRSDGMVVALDAQTGAVRWQVDVEAGLINPLDQLWAVDDHVVIPALEGRLIVLDAAAGAERWRFEPPADRLGGITVARGRVWFMLENARLYGLDLRTGRPSARLTDLELALNGMGLTQRPTFVGDRLIFPAGLMLIGLELPEEAP